MRYATSSTSIAYNLLNLPQQVQLVGDRKITNTYASDGRKLATVAKDGLQFTEGTKTYNGNLVFDLNGDLEYVLFSEGRILHDAGSFTYEYHLRDHLGSTRVAFTPSLGGGQGEAVQVNAFYPFGAPIAALSWSSQTQNKNRYLREGKEYVSDHGWNKYDYHARIYNPITGQFEQLDPLSEHFPNVSGYTAFNNNPVKFVDPTGKSAQNPPYMSSEEAKIRKAHEHLQKAKEAESNIFKGSSISVGTQVAGAELSVEVGNSKASVGVKVGSAEAKLSTDNPSVNVSGVELNASLNVENVVEANANVSAGNLTFSPEGGLDASLGSTSGNVKVGNTVYGSATFDNKFAIGAKVSVVKVELSINFDAIKTWAQGLWNSFTTLITPDIKPIIYQEKEP